MHLMLYHPESLYLLAGIRHNDLMRDAAAMRRARQLSRHTMPAYSAFLPGIIERAAGPLRRQLGSPFAIRQSRSHTWTSS
jgi:hypothetical protein